MKSIRKAAALLLSAIITLSLLTLPSLPVSASFSGYLPFPAFISSVIGHTPNKYIHQQRDISIKGWIRSNGAIPANDSISSFIRSSLDRTFPIIVSGLSV